MSFKIILLPPDEHSLTLTTSYQHVYSFFEAILLWLDQHQDQYNFEVLVKYRSALHYKRFPPCGLVNKSTQYAGLIKILQGLDRSNVLVIGDISTSLVSVSAMGFTYLPYLYNFLQYKDHPGLNKSLYNPVLAMLPRVCSDISHISYAVEMYSIDRLLPYQYDVRQFVNIPTMQRSVKELILDDMLNKENDHDTNFA